MKQEIEHLRNVIRQHEYRYYVENAPIISDQEFDALMHQLIKLLLVWKAQVKQKHLLKNKCFFVLEQNRIINNKSFFIYIYLY